MQTSRDPDPSFERQKVGSDEEDYASQKDFANPYHNRSPYRRHQNMGRRSESDLDLYLKVENPDFNGGMKMMDFQN